MVVQVVQLQLTVVSPKLVPLATGTGLGVAEMVPPLEVDGGPAEAGKTCMVKVATVLEADPAFDPVASCR